MDLSTTYMGLNLGSPLVASASPLTSNVDSIRALAGAGASAVVLHSLFEEQLKHEARELDYYLMHGTDRFAESLSYFPEMTDYRNGPEDYLDLVAAAKAAVKIPVIASLNGISAEGLMEYAEKIQDAGADALELNIYFLPTDPNVRGQQVEDVYRACLQVVKEVLTIPVAMKLSPYFSSTAAICRKLDELGADGLVLFNRFYQPDFDVDKLEVAADLHLSTSDDSRLPLRWIAILHGQLQCSLAATSGIHTGLDVAKMILAGADVTMMASALLANGPGHLEKIRAELVEIMDRKEYESVAQMKGVLSQRNCAEPAAFERANYMKVLNSYVSTGTLE